MSWRTPDLISGVRSLTVLVVDRRDMAEVERALAFFSISLIVGRRTRTAVGRRTALRSACIQATGTSLLGERLGVMGKENELDLELGGAGGGAKPTLSSSSPVDSAEPEYVLGELHCDPLNADSLSSPLSLSLSSWVPCRTNSTRE